jgi:hypothetical protein
MQIYFHSSLVGTGLNRKKEERSYFYTYRIVLHVCENTYPVLVHVLD